MKQYIMKKLLLLLMAIAITSLAASAATKYEINIAGTEVTSDNAGYIGASSGNDIESGYAVYNASNNTLTCYSLKILRSGNGNFGIHNRKRDNLTIVFKGECRVAAADHAMNLARSTTITADAGCNLYVYTGGSSHALNLDSYNYYIKGSGNIILNGKNAIHGNGSGSTTVYFQGAKVSTESNLGSNYKNHALESFKAVFNEGADLIINSNGSTTSVNNVSMYFYGKETVLSPYGAYYSNSAIYSSSGSQITSQDIYISDQYVAKLSSDYFPDANFRGYLQRVLFPKGYITTSDVNATTSMNASSEYISSLQGIGYFSKLVNFSCEENNLTWIPSLPSTLKYLNCRNNNLTSLPSLPSGLTSLICDQNQLTALPTMPSTLQTLECENNKLSGTVNLCNLSLKTLSIQNNPNMTTILCYNNALTSLYFSGCTGLTTIQCYNNQLTLLGNLPTSLQYLYAYNNKFSGNFNMTNRSALKYVNLSSNPNVTRINVANNSSLTQLIVDNCSSMTTLFCDNNKLTSLSFSNCPQLTYIDCRNNQLTYFETTLPSSLENLYCANNKFNDTFTLTGRSNLKTLDISSNPNLTTLNCYNNPALYSLNVQNCSAMTTLQCYSNNLSSLDLSGCSALIYLSCHYNKISSLTNLPSSLQTLYCNDNKLSGTIEWWGRVNLKILDIKNNPNLTALDCFSCSLTSLSVTGCSSLVNLNCHNNKLTTLSVQGCNALREIVCHGNQIKESGMSTLVGSLCTIPSGSSGNLLVISTTNSSEGNVITSSQVQTARNKRWYPKKKNSNGNWVDIPASSGGVHGDVNGDGIVSSQDITLLYNVLLTGNYTGVVNGDVNGDGTISSADITEIYSILLGVN